MPNQSKVQRFLGYSPARYLLLLLVSFSLYWPSFQFEYIDYDDQLYIQQDTTIRSLDLESLKTIFLEPYSAAWYPITRLSFALEYRVFKGQPSGTHFVNVLLHFLNALLIMKLLLQVGSKVFAASTDRAPVLYSAVFAGMLFVVHPQHIEAVAWAVQRKELLATFFGLLSIHMFFFNQSLMAAIFLLAAMMSKGSAVIVPALILLISIASQRPGETNPRSMTKTIWSVRWLMLLGFAGAILTMLTHTAEDSLYQGQFGLMTRLAIYSYNSLLGFVQFIALRPGMFHMPLSNDIISGGLLAQLSVSLIILSIVVCGFLLIMGNRSWKLGAAGILCYLAALVPVAGFVIFGNYAFGDRYLYLSSIGLYIAVFTATCYWFRRRSGTGARLLPTALLTTYLIACAWSVHNVLPKFKNTQALWTHDVKKRPDAVFANQQLGSLYFLSGELDKAAIYFGNVLDSKSEPFRIASREASALYLSEIYCVRGQRQQAIKVLSRISDFGGDVTVVESLLESLRHSGLEPCAQIISDWYEQLP